ncbi:hypothetical protein [Streptomyces sp. NPDC003631]
MNTREQLEKLNEEADMFYKLTNIAGALISDEVYSKEDAAKEIINFVNHRLGSMSHIFLNNDK